MHRRRLRGGLRTTAIYASLVAVSLFILFPFYWLVIASLGEPLESRVDLSPSIQSFSLDSYARVLTLTQFPRWFSNSLLVSTATTVIAVAISILAAYALARMRFAGRRLFAGSVLVTQMLPPILLAIPWYVILTRLRLVNTYQGLILTYLTLALPFSIWMLNGYFQSIPVGLEEAAMLDGCGRMGVITRIMLPLSAPGIATVALFAFVLAWEEFLYALMIMASDEMITVTVGASRLVTDQLVYFGYVGAYGVLAVLPVACVFAFLQRYLVQGLTLGAMK